MLTRDHLTAAGISEAILERAEAIGLTIADVLSLIVKYGPVALQILQEVTNLLQGKTP
jgi:hypothetical protein